MNATTFTVVYGLAGGIFLVAAILLVRPLRLTPIRYRWIPLALAALVLASLAGFTIYAYFKIPQKDQTEWVSALIFLAGGILVLLGIQMVGSRSVKETLEKDKFRKEADLFRQSFEKAPQIVVIKDSQGTYVYANPAYHHFLGKKDQDLTAETDFKFFPRAQANAFRQEEEKVLETNSIRVRDEDVRGIDGMHWLRITRAPLVSDKGDAVGVLVSAQDITLQKLGDSALLYLKNDLNTLEEAEKNLAEALETSDNWESVLAWAGKITGADHGGVWQVMPERSTALLKTGIGKLASLAGSQLRAGESVIWKTWQSGEIQLINDYPNWPGRGQWMRDAGFSANISLPLRVNSQGYVLTLFSDKPGFTFREEQIQLLTIFSVMVACRFQNAERSLSYQSEIDEWKRKQEASQYRMRLEHVVAVIASHFINVDLEKADEGITRSLQTIARFTGVDRCYLALFPHEDITGPDQTNWYTSWTGTALETKADYASEDFNWYMNRLNQLEPIHIPRVSELVQDNEEAAEYLKARKVKSFTAIPLVLNRSVIGYLGFETLRNELEWSQDILVLLKVCADVFVNLLERKWSAKKVKLHLQELANQISLLEKLNAESSLMTEMGDLLQACRTSDEAYPILIRYVQRLIPVGSGALYMMQEGPKDPAEKVAVWGNNPPGATEHEMGANECWSLRRGRIYSVDDPATEPVCGHIKETIHAGYMCVPLIAQGTAVGVLHLRLPENSANLDQYTQNQQQLAAKIGEYIAVPLMNLKLRDELRSQAIRDPLTGLFNRRYMEETLVREVRRAVRHSTSVGIIMFDIDKMKPINDRFGHDAGDLVLRALGRELLSLFRGEDVACRYGGDEFTIVLPEATLADVWRRAEQMREGVKKLNLNYEGKQIGPLTLSIGVAAFPDHGQTAERVLLASDAASYVSKSEGGDRIMMGHRVEQ